jgi:hypothetical protein
MPEPEVEGAPPQEKRSFVSSDDIPKERKESPKEVPKETIEKVEGKEVRILKPEIALTLMYGKLDAILTEMRTLTSIFSKAATSQSFSNSTVTPKEPQSIPASAVKPTEQTPRVKEILAALDPYKDLLNIDTESSTMLVLVKPAQFLGSENFSKIAATIRTIGGQYVSMGKNSHFEVPKAPKRT